VDSNLETGLKGLFAAGDEVGGMPWSASPGAFTMGWRAGENAALEAAEQKGFTDNSASATAALGEFMQHMTQARHGQHWREAETAVQNIVDYYASNHRSEHMLQRGLTRLNELSEVINFKAENPHEAGHCLEIRSLIENAEMVMRASIERKESRKVPFGFLRADYPEPDNAEYFAFLSQQLTGKTVRFAKIALQS
jgi:adenylylsulfate reductase subunit A